MGCFGSHFASGHFEQGKVIVVASNQVRDNRRTGWEGIVKISEEKSVLNFVGNLDQVVQIYARDQR